MTPSSRRGLELKLPGLLLLPQLPPTIYRSFERSRSRTLRMNGRRRISSQLRCESGWRRRMTAR